MGVRKSAAALVVAWAAAGSGQGATGPRPGGVHWDGDLDGPVALAAMSCPEDLTIECDAATNDAVRQAWLDEFVGSPTPGCAVVDDAIDVRPGRLFATLAFPDFSSLSFFTLNGATAGLGNPVLSGNHWVLRLTNALNQSGSAFVTQEATLATDASFSAFFSYQITNPMGISDRDGMGADGLVFVVQTVSNTAGGAGGGLGYQGIVRSLGIEIDTWDNGFWDDFDGNHVGIDLDGSVDSVVQVNEGRRYNDGAIGYVWVEYDGSTDVLEVRESRSATRPAVPTMSVVIDLVSILGRTTAFVGFTSGTGAGGGWHDIRSFFFSNTLTTLGCGGTRSEIVTRTLADSCGDVASCTRSFAIVDTRPPEVQQGVLSPCFPSSAAAQAAALAATVARDACASTSLTTLVSGACTATVTVNAIDQCLNVSTVDYPVTIAAPPFLAPRPPLASCPGDVVVPADTFDGTVVPLGIVALGTCPPPPLVVNDRTTGGSDATDLYPCGTTEVTFTATGGCGFASECVARVIVQGATPVPDLGPVLRVRKVRGAVPILDWSLAGPLAPELRVTVLTSLGVPGLAPHPQGQLVNALSWEEPQPAPPIIWYDVRRANCAGDLSLD